MLTNTITPPANAQIGAAQDIFNALFHRSGNFRVELDYDIVVEFVQLIGEWNDFVPEAVLDALQRIDRLVPRCPTTGDRTYTLGIGREGSPVLYLERNEFPWSEKLSDGAIQTICQEMALFGNADEVNHQVHQFVVCKGRKIEIRFWWD